MLSNHQDVSHTSANTEIDIMAKPEPLVQFLADLVNDKDLQEKYKRNPNQVIRDSDLADDVIKALIDKDDDAVGGEIIKEMNPSNPFIF